MKELHQIDTYGPGIVFSQGLSSLVPSSLCSPERLKLSVDDSQGVATCVSKIKCSLQDINGSME